MYNHFLFYNNSLASPSVLLRSLYGFPSVGLACLTIGQEYPTIGLTYPTVRLASRTHFTTMLTQLYDMFHTLFVNIDMTCIPTRSLLQVSSKQLFYKLFVCILIIHSVKIPGVFPPTVRHASPTIGLPT